MTSARTRPPGPVQWARGLLVLVAAGHVAVPLVLWSEGAQEGIGGALAIHVPLAVLSLVLARALSSGSPWALRPAAVSQVLSILFSVLLWSSPTTARSVTPILVAVQLSVLVLLWAPGSARAFFLRGARSGPRDMVRAADPA